MKKPVSPQTPPRAKYLKYSDIKNSIAYNKIKSKNLKNILFSPTRSAVIKRARSTLYNFLKSEIKKDKSKKTKK